MSGSAGVFAAAAAYLKRLRAACNRIQYPLIFDEVHHRLRPVSSAAFAGARLTA